MAKKTKKPVAKKATKPAKKAPAKPAKKVSKPASSKKAVKKAIKPVAKKAVKPVKKAAKPVAKKATRPVAKKAVKKVAKPVAKKVTAKSKVTKKAAKPVAKKAKQVLKKVSKPVAKKPVKKAVKPVAKKTTKPVAKKPVAKAPVKKVVKTPAKPAPKPIKVEVKITPKAFSKPVETKKTQPVVVPAEPKKQPSYSKPAPAIIRDHVDEQIAGKTRYSDSELNEFRELIHQKLSVAREELANLIEQMQNPSMNAGDDSDNSYKTLEDGSSTAEKEYISQLAARQRKFIENLDNALVRIENKTYGICRVTGKLISKERLRAVPHTTLSMEAKVQQYK